MLLVAVAALRIHRQLNADVAQAARADDASFGRQDRPGALDRIAGEGVRVTDDQVLTVRGLPQVRTGTCGSGRDYCSTCEESEYCLRKTSMSSWGNEGIARSTKVKTFSIFAQ